MASDILTRLEAAQEWMRKPDWADNFSAVDFARWLNDRPTSLLPAVQAEIASLRQQLAASQAKDGTTLYAVIADIREKSGVGAKPMLSELADAIAAKMQAREAEAYERAAKVAFDHIREHGPNGVAAAIRALTKEVDDAR